MLLLCSFTGYTQTQWIDSVKKVLVTQEADTNKVHTLISISGAYQLSIPDSGLVYAVQALDLAEKLHFEPGIFWAEINASNASMILGNYPAQLDYAFKALSLSKKLNTPRTTGYANGMLSGYYYGLGEYSTSLSYWREAKKTVEQWFPDEMFGIWINLSGIFEGLNQPDSAMLYAKKAYKKIIRDQPPYKGDYERSRQLCLAFTTLGNAFTGKGKYDSALFFYRIGIPVSANIHWELNVVEGYNGIASVYKATGKLDSAVWYAEKVLDAKVARSYPVGLLKAADLLSAVYELKNRPDSTLKYLRMAIALKDSLFNRKKMIAIQNLTYHEQEKEQEIAAAEIKLKNQFILYVLLVSAIALLVITGIVLKTKKQKQLQNMRNRIADDLHDDIGSTLSSISIMSELAKTKSPEAVSLLTSIGESTVSLQENMSDIVWAIKPENDHFENLSQRMNQFASEILDARNIELDFVSDATLYPSKLTMEQRKNLYLFFKEVINNAAKYSDAKKVSVSILQKDHYAELNIRDDGRGFDTTKVFSGNGMNTLRKRAAEINANFKITSHLNAGTVVQLIFKIT